MKLFWAVLGGACCTGHILVAEPQITYNSFGMPGLIDMPSAQSAADAELIFSVSQSGKSLRNTFDDLPNKNPREYMIIGKERHDVGRENDEGYPVRGIVGGKYF